jgi:DNA repair protein RecN (Recombination protein N)
VGEAGAATVVFDEIDVGIGGAVAEIVGRRMRDLGRHRQVLAVTHQPQVAALAHHHVAVRKDQHEHASHSRVMTLDGESREQELARMLGGVDVTQRTLEHAREMLAAGRAPAAKGKRRRRPAA